MIKKEGLIKKAISGFYYVISDGELYECKARGVFRNENESPLVGDRVEIEIDETGKGVVTKIGERKNEFRRPPIANIDKLFIVASVRDPRPSLIVIDKLIAVCEYKDIEPIIVITKTDLGEADELMRIYKKAGFKTIPVCNMDEDSDLSEIKAEIKGSVCAFAGNTGVGKSSLINRICPKLSLDTSHISKKLGRGRHTTRHVELFFSNELSGFVADTPGFGSMDMAQYEIIRKDKLELVFREFEPYLNKCKFTGCSHTIEKGCAVIEALNNGEISKERHESYVALYNEAKQIKEWELKK